MHENILATAARLSDDALHARLKHFAGRERDATVELVGHLAELDGRKTYLGEGPGRVYTYCRDVLGYSEDAAWNRAATAGAVRLYPVILGWLSPTSRLRSGSCPPLLPYPPRCCRWRRTVPRPRHRWHRRRSIAP